MTNFNPGIVPQGPAPSVGSNPGQRTTQGAEVKVKVPGIAQYNPDTKMPGEARPWNVTSVEKKPAAEKKEAEVKVKPIPTDTEAQKARHEKWKAEQAAKKEAKIKADNARAAEKQALARDYLKEGNITKAADALGVSVTELITLTQNAALQIKTEEKKLTPAEQQAKDFADYKAAKELELQRLSQTQYTLIANNWIDKNIAPVMADTSKYELINLNKDNILKLQMAVYEYLNKLNAEGKPLPKVEEVLDTIEKEAEEFAKQNLTQYKNVKKFKTLFGPDGEEVKPAKKAKKAPEPTEEESMEEELDLATDDQLGADDPEVEEVKPEEDDEEEVYETKNFNVSKASAKNVPFALMSPTEKLRFLQEARKPKKK